MSDDSFALFGSGPPRVRSGRASQLATEKPVESVASASEAPREQTDGELYSFGAAAPGEGPHEVDRSEYLFSARDLVNPEVVTASERVVPISFEPVAFVPEVLTNPTPLREREPEPEPPKMPVPSTPVTYRREPNTEQLIPPFPGVDAARNGRWRLAVIAAIAAVLLGAGVLFMATRGSGAAVAPVPRPAPVAQTSQPDPTPVATPSPAPPTAPASVAPTSAPTPPPSPITFSATGSAGGASPNCPTGVPVAGGCRYPLSTAASGSVEVRAAAPGGASICAQVTTPDGGLVIGSCSAGTVSVTTSAAAGSYFVAITSPSPVTFTTSIKHL